MPGWLSNLRDHERKPRAGIFQAGFVWPWVALSGSPMHTYRLYFHGGDGHFVDVVPYECAGDDEAICFAREQADHRPMELWQQARKVTDFPA